ncbi:MAG: phosphoribosylglycinamide formyltransferase [Ardenticatenales bacterium]|nr:phosphoribosylglycinamide formyltransferase [Ardenticatenales bacterium]
MNSTTKRLVVLISGTGATLQAILDGTRWETLDAEVVAVFSHEPWSYGLLRAEREGIDASLHDFADYRFEGKSESDYEQELADKIAAYRPDLIILAGWKHPLYEGFFQRFPERVVNLHSGLPGPEPLFDPYGQNPVSRAFEAYNAGVIHEAQVAVQVLDGSEPFGKIVAEQRVPIYDFDTLIDLEDRMNRAQEELLVNTLRLLLRDAQPRAARAYLS